MIRIEGLASFTAVADAGSISAAAKRLGLSKSVVSERLADLEREVGARLVQRTTRKLSLTEDGQAFLARARRILGEVEDGLEEMSERRGELTGPLRLSGPVSFGTLHLGPALYPFLRQHPGISLSLDLDDRFVDIAADGYDAVIRHGPVGDGRLVAHRLAPSRRMLVASPGYLAEHGVPSSLDELQVHKAILFSQRETDWRFTAKDGSRVVRPAAYLRVNNGHILRDAAEGAEVLIAYPKERTASAKIQALTEHLREVFGDPPYWERLA
jgi:DNA-binding transcriptional LysR family regulator